MAVTGTATNAEVISKLPTSQVIIPVIQIPVTQGRGMIAGIVLSVVPPFSPFKHSYDYRAGEDG